MFAVAGNVVVRRDPLVMWQAANWAFDFVVGEVRRLIPDGGLVAAELDRVGNPHALKDLDITLWTPEDREQLAQAVDALANVMRELGPGFMASPEFFPGLLADVEELSQKVRKP